MHSSLLLSSAVLLGSMQTVWAVVTGDLTFFTPDTGACGNVNYESELIVAVSDTFFDKSQGRVCGRHICINGETIKARIEDRCIGCDTFDIDATALLFSKIADLDVGRLKVNWWFCDDGPDLTQLFPNLVHPPPERQSPRPPSQSPKPSPVSTTTTQTKSKTKTKASTVSTSIISVSTTSQSPVITSISPLVPPGRTGCFKKH
ncbi:hypothetical protein BDV3_005215 [Batrachochytrium dendrobatidis]|uniref:RlpA-like protein double-psi beta-barrel domain-containing protein n=1 Tax=Batrachochytrium dendrobatidis (strain JEL423) TaxID=403673 RepID=A0A177WGZ4_BATDL|nr:hypothetical protein BDEG_23230 [Batrachochytrium dendrobatidis JEL423]